MIGITTNRAGFRKEFERTLARAKNPTAVLMAAGRELANQLRAHFRRNEREHPNQLSPRREHFWLQVMRSVNNPEQTGFNAVSVRVSDPRIAQKVLGGKIVAKRAKALTIPVSEEAYGRTASTFERETGFKLFVVRGAHGAVLATRRLGAGGKGGGLQVEYILTQAVTQKADPHALPEEQALETAVQRRADAVLKRQLQS